MNKRAVIQSIREEFQRQFDLLQRASRSAREDATDSESRASSKYDTQGLEASYLAAGQAERAEELALALQAFNAEPFPPFPSDAEISAGALVETRSNGVRDLFLLAPSAGGLSCEHEGLEVTLLGPTAPLRKKLLGKKVGAKIDQPPMTISGVY